MSVFSNISFKAQSQNADLSRSWAIYANSIGKTTHNRSVNELFESMIVDSMVSRLHKFMRDINYGMRIEQISSLQNSDDYCNNVDLPKPCEEVYVRVSVGPIDLCQEFSNSHNNFGARKLTESETLLVFEIESIGVVMFAAIFKEAHGRKTYVVYSSAGFEKTKGDVISSLDPVGRIEIGALGVINVLAGLSYRRFHSENWELRQIIQLPRNNW